MIFFSKSLHNKHSRTWCSISLDIFNTDKCSLPASTQTCLARPSQNQTWLFWTQCSYLVSWFSDWSGDLCLNMTFFDLLSLQLKYLFWWHSDLLHITFSDRIFPSHSTANTIYELSLNTAKQQTSWNSYQFFKMAS